MPIRLVTQKPMVTAGFKWPPEMWPTAVTMMAMARPLASGDAEQADAG